MNDTSRTHDALLTEIEQLKQRLEEAESTIRAIRGGEVDAFLVRQGTEDAVLVLEGSDRPYRALIERMQQGAVTISADGTILYANPRFAELVGRPASGLLGTDLCACASAEARATLSARIRGEPSDAALEFDLLRADGTRLPVAVTISPITAGSGVLSLIITDVTEQRRRAAERERFAQERAARTAAETTATMLRESHRRKDEFLAMLAHELRTPLTPLLNGIEILNAIGSQAPEGKRTRDMMRRQLEMLIRLVDDLLDVGRVTQGKIELQKQRADLKAIVQMAVESTRGLIEQRGHRLEIALPDDELLLHVDVVRVAQIVMNLLNNAAKFTPGGGNLWLVVERAGDQAIVRVRDDGIGIRAEELPRMFDLFTQADPTVSRAEGGLGIGLTLAQRLAELHGGSLDGASEGIGRGSEFTVRLPLVAGKSAEPAVAPRPLPAFSQRAVKPLRVLLVDDNRDSADSLAFLLRLGGHDVRLECHGLGALAAASEFKPDLLLLDIGLPGMDGYEVARRLRSQPETQSIQIVALSGYGSEEDRSRSRSAGFLDHLVKPVDFGALDAIFVTVAQSAPKRKAAGSGS